MCSLDNARIFFQFFQNLIEKEKIKLNSNPLKCPAKNSSVWKCSTIKKVDGLDEEGWESYLCENYGVSQARKPRKYWIRNLFCSHVYLKASGPHLSVSSFHFQTEHSEYSETHILHVDCCFCLKSVSILITTEDLKGK